MAIALWRVKDIEATDLAVPELRWVGEGTALCLILPHELQAVALRAPKGLLEFKEDLVSGTDAQAVDGSHLLRGQAWPKETGILPLEHAQRNGHNHVVRWDHLTILALHDYRPLLILVPPPLLGILSTLATLPSVVIVITLTTGLNLRTSRASRGLVPVDATDGFPQLDDVWGNALSQQLHNSHEARGDDVMGAGDLRPFSKGAQGHFIYAVGAALTALHLKEDPEKPGEAELGHTRNKSSEQQGTLDPDSPRIHLFHSSISTPQQRYLQVLLDHGELQALGGLCVVRVILDAIPHLLPGEHPDTVLTLSIDWFTMPEELLGQVIDLTKRPKH